MIWSGFAMYISNWLLLCLFTVAEEWGTQEPEESIWPPRKSFFPFQSSTMLMLHLLLLAWKESIFLCISQSRDSLHSLFWLLVISLVKAANQQLRYFFFFLEIELIYKSSEALTLCWSNFSGCSICTTDGCRLCNCSSWRFFFWSFWVWFGFNICLFPGLFSFFFFSFSLASIPPHQPYDIRRYCFHPCCFADHVPRAGGEVWCRRRAFLDRDNVL